MVESGKYLSENINSVNKKIFCGDNVYIPKIVLEKYGIIEEDNIVIEERQEIY